MFDKRNCVAESSEVKSAVLKVLPKMYEEGYNLHNTQQFTQHDEQFSLSMLDEFA